MRRKQPTCSAAAISHWRHRSRFTPRLDYLSIKVKKPEYFWRGPFVVKPVSPDGLRADLWSLAEPNPCFETAHYTRLRQGAPEFRLFDPDPPSANINEFLSDEGYSGLQVEGTALLSRTKTITRAIRSVMDDALLSLWGPTTWSVSRPCFKGCIRASYGR